MTEFREMLNNVNRSYTDFVHAVMTYVNTPGNEKKRFMIEEYIRSNPTANSSDVLQFIVEKTDFFSANIQNDRNYSIAV